MKRTKILLTTMTAFTMLGSACSKDTAQATSSPDDVEV